MGARDLSRAGPSPPAPEGHPRSPGLGVRVAILAVRAYQVFLGPFLGGRCRFLPSCSEYAVEALRVHGLVRGASLTARRIGRCRPFGGHGHDPVPPAS